MQKSGIRKKSNKPLDLYSLYEYNKLHIMYSVDLSPIKKSLKKAPYFICNKVQIWADMVEKEGLPAVQKVKGFKDHPLKGNRKGQRTVYLNRKWRLIYTINKENQFFIVKIEEISPHDY